MTIAETKQPPVTAPVSPGSETPDRPKTGSQFDYRPDIDGLRAIAVLAVIGFHTFPAWIRGGFVGVDVFFVISGYLISTILFTGMERGSFRFLQFYIRRIRRIFPTLIVVLLACMVAGWLVLFSSEYKALGKHVAGSAAFVSNFVLWNEAGYFDKAAETKPLLHIWSLGIEEQFYIIWPLLLYLTWRFRIRTLALLLLLLLGSFVFNVHAVEIDAAADFFSPLTRFWELVAGALLAYLSLYPSPAQAGVLRRLPSVRLWLGAGDASHSGLNSIKAVCGLLLVVIAILIIGETRRFPGWWALMPVVGTYLMIAAGPSHWIGRRLLASRVLVAIGLISYPLYLWHWPLLSFVRIVNGAAPSATTTWLVILLTFLLAWLTYLFVEKPLRFGKSGGIKAGALLIAMAMVGWAGYFTYAESGFALRNPSAEDLVAAAQDFEHSEGLALGNPDAEETVLVGDSTMGQYIPRVRKLIEQHAIDLNRNRVVFLLEAGCPPISDIANEANRLCAQFVDKALPTLNDRRIKTVAFAAWWTTELAGDDRFYLRSDTPKVSLPTSEAAQDRAVANFSSVISHLVASGKRVFVLLETPSGWVYDPAASIPTGWHRLLDRPKAPPSWTRSFVDEFVGKISEKVERAASAAGAQVIKPLDYLCDSQTCPITDKDGHHMYYDYGHLRQSYVRDQATYIDQIFLPDVDRAKPTDGPSAR
jgi:peptidoglycan/LPS O-acetylase OafA/YrhL